MSLTLLEKVVLGLSGLTSVGVGGFILAAPHAFYASYGISLGDDPNLLSELRAPAAGLFALGVLMLAGIWRAAMAQISIVSALVVFVAFPAGRLIGLAVDGMPSQGIIGAFVIEMAIAALCVFAFRGRITRANRDLAESYAQS
ncbi:DUF4345 domain-containing protein [Yoonia sp. 2307UL14-13]|uniref:DUF4345 domain-containing protein n=1 Tax=Yoonia sp. 2307UL14-13 TaxID=3126506 RepID=UPI0030B756A4